MEAVFHISPAHHRIKTKPEALGAMMQILARERMVQVAYMQGSTAITDDDCFEDFVNWIKEGVVWGLNIGEIRFSEEQLQRMTEVLKNSNITHMFYECTFMTPKMKRQWRDIIRGNRRKHRRWSLEGGQPAVVLACKNMWFNPVNHTTNKKFQRKSRKKARRLE